MLTLHCGQTSSWSKPVYEWQWFVVGYSEAIAPASSGRRPGVSSPTSFGLLRPLRLSIGFVGSAAADERTSARSKVDTRGKDRHEREGTCPKMPLACTMQKALRISAQKHTNEEQPSPSDTGA